MTNTWIIGASSGIGEALAIELAKRGETVCVTARNAQAIEAVKARLPGHGHVALAADATDMSALMSTAQKLFHVWTQVDRVIFMAGAYTPMRLGELDLKETRSIIEINLAGAFNTVEVALSLLKSQTGGQIVLCGSVAGYRGLPNAQPYAATKAGVISLANSLRAEWGQRFDIKLINPGFVTSRLTDKNDFDMPMKITAEKAAQIIAKGLNSKRFEIHFPAAFSIGAKLLAILPDGLFFNAVKGMKR
jgi:short-subunit dehydrogenase